MPPSDYKGSSRITTAMLASAAVNLGMASMSLSKQAQISPPPLPSRAPIGSKTPTIPAKPSESNNIPPALIPLSPTGQVPPPLPSRPPQSSKTFLETTDLDFDGMYIFLAAFFVISLIFRSIFYFFVASFNIFS